MRIEMALNRIHSEDDCKRYKPNSFSLYLCVGIIVSVTQIPEILWENFIGMIKRSYLIWFKIGTVVAYFCCTANGIGAADTDFA